MSNKLAFFAALVNVWLLFPSPASALLVEEELPFLGIPEKQWLVVVQNGAMRQIAANIRKTPGALYVSAALEESALPNTEALVSGVVKLVDGRVYSTPFHALGKHEVVKESSAAAHIRADELRREIAGYKERIAELDQAMASANTALRKAAGLEEVDKIYARIAELEAVVNKHEAVRKESDELIRQLKVKHE